jgi:transcription elongation factor Elf1
VVEGSGEYTVTCPHCGKEFTSAPLVDDGGRPSGFKCSHCRLFVPFERAEKQDLVKPAE